MVGRLVLVASRLALHDPVPAFVLASSLRHKGGPGPGPGSGPAPGTGSAKGQAGRYLLVRHAVDSEVPAPLPPRYQYVDGGSATPLPSLPRRPAVGPWLKPSAGAATPRRPAPGVLSCPLGGWHGGNRRADLSPGTAGRVEEWVPADRILACLDVGVPYSAPPGDAPAEPAAPADPAAPASAAEPATPPAKRARTE